MNQWVSSALSLAVMLFISACASYPVGESSGQAAVKNDVRSIFSGEWEYEDGASVTLILNEQGNGTYAYKDGRFHTVRLGNRIWVGTWHQKENDREGGFSVKLSQDYSEGDGTWWDTRIGSDHAPSQKGGTFRLSKHRKAALTKPY